MYTDDSDVKRDSLVENEMREDLNDEEFKSFSFSLAKSLGIPYFNKGFVNVRELTKYVVNDNFSAEKSSFYRRLIRLIKVGRDATPKVKKLFEEEKIDRYHSLYFLINSFKTSL